MMSRDVVVYGSVLGVRSGVRMFNVPKALVMVECRYCEVRVTSYESYSAFRPPQDKIRYDENAKK